MYENAWPKLELFPRLAKVARFLGHVLTGPNCLSSHGNHFLREPKWFDDDPLASPTQPYLDLHETDDGLESWHSDPNAWDVVVKDHE